MKKLYILPLLVAGLQFAGCSDKDESIFDQSAAERLEAGQKEYFQALCADGGNWVMEYFSNVEEPGYVFVLHFDADKSVTFHTDHKWIGNAYKSERSLWDVINDNGNVLSFNSYNTLFHVFSTPENIEGNYAPKDDRGEDVDELGYGHNGDYEFLLMENDGQTIRLRGKKRALYTYLRRLPADVDIEKYLAGISTLRNQFDAKRFPNYVMTETATGAQYDITGLSSGVVSIVPLNSTSPYSRTVKQPCVITPAGMRPEAAFDCIREDDSHFSVSEFTWEADGALVAPGVRLTAPAAPVNMLRQDLKSWVIVDGSMSPVLTAALSDANAETKKIGGSAAITQVFGRNPVLSNLSIGYESLSGKVLFCLKGNCGKQPFKYYGSIEAIDATKVKIELTTHDDPLRLTIIPTAPKAQEFFDLFAGEFTVVNEKPMDPSVIQVKSVSNPDIFFTLQLK
ncbi:MAG: DUF4302 domain-containing protein [Muribaculaceae bacterium]|nr:DUF4302 domain-containing protein [Muribaculaceae bacterium]